MSDSRVALAGNTAIGWGEADYKTSGKAIFRALDLGVNFFDTADTRISMK